MARRLSCAVFVLGLLAIGGDIEGAVVMGGASAIGAKRFNIGMPKDSILNYEIALKTDKFLVIASGTRNMRRPRGASSKDAPARLDTHSLKCAVVDDPAHTIAS